MTAHQCDRCYRDALLGLGWGPTWLCAVHLEREMDIIEGRT